VAATIVIPPVVSARLAARPEQIADFCRGRQIGELALFGSILRDDFGVSSDVDVLVSFSPGARPGLFDLAQMEEELSQLIGRKVDLVTRGAVERSDNWIRRHAILSTAVPLYVAEPPR
jgi:hypothetical protein